MRDLLSAMQAWWKTWGGTVETVLGAFKTVIETYLGTVLANVFDGVRLLMQLLNGDWEGAWGTFKGIVSRTFEAIKTIVGTIMSAVGTVLHDVMTISILPAWKDGWDEFGANAAATWNSIVETVKAGVNEVIGFINDLLEAWNGISFTIPRIEFSMPTNRLPAKRSSRASRSGGAEDLRRPSASAHPDAGDRWHRDGAHARAPRRERTRAVVPLGRGGGVVSTWTFALDHLRVSDLEDLVVRAVVKAQRRGRLSPA